MYVRTIYAKQLLLSQVAVGRRLHDQTFVVVCLLLCCSCMVSSHSVNSFSRSHTYTSTRTEAYMIEHRPDASTPWRTVGVRWNRMPRIDSLNTNSISGSGSAAVVIIVSLDCMAAASAAVISCMPSNPCDASSPAASYVVRWSPAAKQLALYMALATSLASAFEPVLLVALVSVGFKSLFKWCCWCWCFSVFSLEFITILLDTFFVILILILLAVAEGGADATTG